MIGYMTTKSWIYTQVDHETSLYVNEQEQWDIKTTTSSIHLYYDLSNAIKVNEIQYCTQNILYI